MYFHLKKNIYHVQSISGNDGEGARELALLSLEPLPSTLHVFTSQGGLSLLAQHMSLLYPDMAQQVCPGALQGTLTDSPLSMINYPHANRHPYLWWWKIGLTAEGREASIYLTVTVTVAVIIRFLFLWVSSWLKRWTSKTWKLCNRHGYRCQYRQGPHIADALMTGIKSLRKLWD